MSRVVADLAGPLATPLSRVVSAAGKRIRPALTLAVADRIGTPDEAERVDAVRLAASVELLHCATLVHDDLIDAAATRRGVATVSAVEGPPAAVVGGDLLIAASTLLATRTSTRAGVVIATTLAALCRGEALQESLRWRTDASVETLIEVARLKTGSLLEAACLLGADAVHADEATRRAAGEFGLDFGISLQLVDDVIDLVSSPALSGKPVGADFAGGTLTVPAALALVDTPALGKLFRADAGPAAHARATSILQGSGAAVAETVSLARTYADRACTALTGLAGTTTPGPDALAQWPSRYVSAQLDAMVSDQHRWLVEHFGDTA